MNGWERGEMREGTNVDSVASCACVFVCVARWQMLNERGGVESDLTILPLPGDEDDTAAAGGVAGSRDFYAVTSSATCTRDRDHIVPTDHTKPFLSSDRIAFSI